MKTLLPFLLLVLIHHFILAPLLRKKLPLYIGLTVALLVGFGSWCFSKAGNPDGPPPVQRHPELAPMPSPGVKVPQPGRGAGPLRPETMKLIMGVLLVGVDLGVYFFEESRRRARRMKELEAENTKQRLVSLRYQINPHFLMNTLNNIHALVDIDPDKAKESIEEFSKMMRILLYEGDSPAIPLSKELDFIEHFISLMRLRYAEDTLRLETVFPKNCGDVVVPPLVMASFVENAFKHGVSYDSESFILIDVQLLDGKVAFHCVNSSHPSDTDERHGLGLENIRKRLSLLYGETYTLEIDTGSGRYDVLLSLPFSPQLPVS